MPSKCKCVYCGIANLFDLKLADWPTPADIQTDAQDGITVLSLCRRAAGNNPAHLPHDFYFFWLMHSRQTVLVNDAGQSLMVGFDVPVEQGFIDGEKLRRQNQKRNKAV